MGQTRIPTDVTFKHYLAIKSILQDVLQDLELSVGNGSKWVSCRLNQTGTTDLKPFFFGWLENRALESTRISKTQPDPGLFRFMDDADTPNITYQRCLKNPTAVLRQDWKLQNPPLPATHRGTPPIYLYLRDGYFGLPTDHEIYRLSIAIKVDSHYVGTLNTGLSENPGTKLDDKLKKWGQESTSELVQYLKGEFDLGGPIVARQHPTSELVRYVKDEFDIGEPSVRP